MRLECLNADVYTFPYHRRRLICKMVEALDALYYELMRHKEMNEVHAVYTPYASIA